MKTIESLEKQLDRYFAEVTDEQLLRDLENAEFSFYNKIGRVICEASQRQG